jgi:hypothetical protein
VKGFFHRTRDGAGPGGNSLVAALVFLALFFTALPGCGSNTRAYAQDARSSYISARAVLVGVEEFPSRMELLLRSADITAVEEDAAELIEEAEDLLPTATSAFRAASEKAELLKGEGSDKYTPYADMLLELTDMNQQAIDAYSEFMGISNSVLQGLPYGENPESLMPTLDYMEEVATRIDEISARAGRLEEEAEALYVEITG